MPGGPRNSPPPEGNRGDSGVPISPAGVVVVVVFYHEADWREGCAGFWGVGLRGSFELGEDVEEAQEVEFELCWTDYQPEEVHIKLMLLSANFDYKFCWLALL